MRPSQYLFNAAKKSSGFSIPVELTPLFVAMGIACSSAIFFSYRKLAYDGSLRLSRNPKQSSEDLNKYLKEEPAPVAAEPAAPAPATESE